MKKLLGFCIVVVLLVLTGKYIWENQQELIPEKWREKIAVLLENGEKFVEEGEGLVDGAVSSYEGFEGYDIDAADSFHDDYPVESGSFEQTYDRISAQCLNVELGGCTLEILQSDQDVLQVKVVNVGKFQAYEEDGTFYVKATRKAVEDAEDCRVLLYLPSYCWQEAKASLGAGLMQIHGLEANALELEVGAGKLEADTVSAQKLQVLVGAGAATLENMSAGKLTARVDAGSLTARGDVTHHIDAECSIGNVELILDGEATDYNYTIDCVAGSVYLDGEKHTAELGKEKRIDHDALKEMELSCAVGNIKISFAQE